MTKHKPFDIRRRGFTEMECMHLRPIEPRASVPLWLRIVVAASLAVIFVHLFIVPLIPLPEARAAEPMKTNADYCQEWQRGEWRVVGASADDVAVLCAEYL